MKQVYLSLVCFLFIANAAHAQSSTLRFKRFTTSEGLSNEKVHTIIQDARGFMWFGTSNGLNRFDGYQFEVFRKNPAQTYSLNSNQINCLLEDQQGVLWIGTNNGLNYYLPWEHKFYAKSLGDTLDGTLIRDIIEDNQGNLWIGSDNGLWMLDSIRQDWNHFRPNPNGISGQIISTLLLDSKEQLWVGTENDIDRFSPQEKIFHHYPLTNKFQVDRRSTPTFIFEDSRGFFWTASYNSGLNRMDPITQQFQPYPLSLISEKDYLQNRIRDIHEDQQGNLWLATYRGIILLDPETGKDILIEEDYSNTNGLIHESINCFFEDQQNNLWMGSFWGGVNYFDKNYNLFRHYQTTRESHTLSYNVITGFTEGTDGAVWISASRGGLNAFDPKTGLFQQHRQKEPENTSTSSNHIQLIESDPEGNLWLGTLYGGLHYFNTKTKQFNPVLFSDTAATHYKLKSIHFEPQKGLWLGTQDGLFLYHLPSRVLEIFTPPGNTPINLKTTNCILAGRDQSTLWIGTQDDKGLVRLQSDSRKFEAYAIPQVNCVLESQNQLVWAGTNGYGFYSLNPTTRAITHYPPHEKFNGQVYGILEDANGYLWMSTPDGLVCFFPRDETFRYYDNSDGLQGNQFTKNAFLKTSNGDFYFGGTNGFSVFDPAQIKNDHFLPQLAITNIKIGTKSGKPRNIKPLQAPQAKKTLLKFKHFENTFFFDFVALNYSKPEKTEYAYKLEGFDDWNYIGNRRNATYTNISPGKYAFKVKATNGSGIWTSPTEGLVMQVLPPPWKTRWAYGLYSLAAIAVFLLGRRIILNRINLKNELKIGQIQLKQEQEFHEMKLRFFTNISHELRTPLTLILGPLEKLSQSFAGKSSMRKQLHIAINNADRLSQLINQLLDFRKLESDHMELLAAKGNFVRFVHEVFLSFKEHASFHNLQYKFVSSQNEIAVWYDRDKMEKVLFNLLSNAFKYTPPGKKITLAIELNTLDQGFKNGSVKVSVKDEGFGIPPEMIPRIFDRFFQGSIPGQNIQGTGIGLSLTKGLIELHQGTISVESEIGKGSDFFFRLPLGSDHLTTQQIIDNFQDSESNQHYKHQESPFLNNENESFAKKENNLVPLPQLLIVEDNHDVREFIADSFSEHYQIIMAENGKEGFEMAVETQPDLIISHVMMPEMNGIDLCSKVKTDFRTSHIPVILLSARTGLIFKVNGLETGAGDYITKPFNLKILGLKVRNLIDSRQKMRARFKKEGALNLTDVAVTTIDERFLEKIVILIEANLKNPDFNVEYLSQEIGLSRAHFYRKIKALTDMTATEFIRSIRLRRASQLLKEELLLNINEVSYEIGIQDPSYFRKCFKQMYGLSPSKYRATL